MCAPCIGDAGKTLEAVADDSTVRIEAAFGEPCNRSGTEAGDPAQLQSNGFSLGGGLYGGDQPRPVRCAATSLPATAFAAEIGVVDLNPAGQTLFGIPLKHDLLELVFDLP